MMQGLFILFALD